MLAIVVERYPTGSRITQPARRKLGVVSTAFAQYLLFAYNNAQQLAEPSTQLFVAVRLQLCNGVAKSLHHNKACL